MYKPLAVGGPFEKITNLTHKSNKIPQCILNPYQYILHGCDDPEPREFSKTVIGQISKNKKRKGIEPPYTAHKYSKTHYREDDDLYCYDNIDDIIEYIDMKNELKNMSMFISTLPKKNNDINRDHWGTDGSYFAHSISQLY
jgi:hypothetical protein